MSVLISKLNNESATTDCPFSVDHLDELREVNSRLRLLVCELLDKNQQLRFQCSDEETANAELSSALSTGWPFNE